MRPIEKVQAIYMAFGRGDVPAILEPLSEDVDWEDGQPGHGIPWLAPGRGRAHVIGFLQTVAAELEFTVFRPHTFLEGAGVVVALVDAEGTMKRSGRRFHEKDEAHIWRFDAAGRIVGFRHRIDTWAQLAAFNGGQPG